MFGSDSHNIVLTVYRKKLPRGVIICKYRYTPGIAINMSPGGGGGGGGGRSKSNLIFASFFINITALSLTYA